MTETTNKTVEEARGILFYDGTCNFCLSGISKIRKPLASINVKVSPFDNGAQEPEMVLQWKDGRKYGGADAAIFLARQYPLTFIPALIAGLFPFRQVARAIYRVIAKNRHCLGNGTCAIDFHDPKDPSLRLEWMLMIFLVSTAIVIGYFTDLAGPVWMWLIAFTMWLGFKFMCYHRAGSFAEVDALFFLWPGMNTDSFAYDNKGKKKTADVTTATIFVLTGIVILTFLSYIPHPIAKGWAGVAAMLCLLHFGSFGWLAAFWNRLGYPVDTIMRHPWISKSVGDFWGNRWNRAFSDWARKFVFRPLTQRFGTTTGTVTGFLASGIAHDTVISIPAGGGYGLPTIYFLIQAFGLLIEKKVRLRNSNGRRLWLWLVVLIPAPLLFHPPFIEEVFNPMTQYLTNLWNQ